MNGACVDYDHKKEVAASRPTTTNGRSGLFTAKHGSGRSLPGWKPAPARSGSWCLRAGGAYIKAYTFPALISDGAPQVFIANRTRARADALKDQFGARVDPQDWTRIPDLVSDCALIVNTTSLGMEGQPPLAIDLSRSQPADGRDRYRLQAA